MSSEYEHARRLYLLNEFRALNVDGIRAGVRITSCLFADILAQLCQRKTARGRQPGDSHKDHLNRTTVLVVLKH
jgi:hypothetical protein